MKSGKDLLQEVKIFNLPKIEHVYEAQALVEAKKEKPPDPTHQNSLNVAFFDHNHGHFCQIKDFYLLQKIITRFDYTNEFFFSPSQNKEMGNLSVPSISLNVLAVLV